MNFIVSPMRNFNTMDNNKRMAINTIILYAKLIITIVVNLYSTRLILSAMGVEDYGVVNLISGIVAMLSFMQNSMSVSSQRFMSVYMGKHDDDLMKKVFSSSFVLHLLLALIFLIVLEALTPIIFGSAIQIPDYRISAAQILYQLTIIGTALVVITVPYDAALNAHENMLLFSIATIIESLIRLAGAFILLVYSNDKLIFYGFLVILIRLVSLMIKSLYCRRYYLETRFSLTNSDKSTMKEMFTFAFWNMFGAMALTGRSQGIAIVMNIFLGVVVNASYGIATQISGQLQNFTATISKAMNPQIMQRAGLGNQEGMMSLALAQSKYSSILLSYAIVPMAFLMPFVLKLWLGEIPEYSVAFCILMLILSAIQQFSIGLMSAIQATGNIKNYQICVSIMMLLNIPLAYILLWLDFSAPVVVVGMILIEVLVCIIRIVFAHKLADLQILRFIKTVIVPVSILYIISSTAVYILKEMFFTTENLISFFTQIFLYFIIITFFAFMVLTKSEREIIIKIVTSKIKK